LVGRNHQERGIPLREKSPEGGNLHQDGNLYLDGNLHKGENRPQEGIPQEEGIPRSEMLSEDRNRLKDGYPQGGNPQGGNPQGGVHQEVDVTEVAAILRHQRENQKLTDPLIEKLLLSDRRNPRETIHPEAKFCNKPREIIPHHLPQIPTAQGHHQDLGQGRKREESHKMEEHLMNQDNFRGNLTMGKRRDFDKLHPIYTGVKERLNKCRVT